MEYKRLDVEYVYRQRMSTSITVGDIYDEDYVKLILTNIYGIDVSDVDIIHIEEEE